MSEPRSPEPLYPLDHESRIARLEGIVEQINIRLERIENKTDANREALETKIDRLYRWIIPLQITTILAVAGLALKAFTG